MSTEKKRQTVDERLCGNSPEAVAAEANVSYRSVERFLAKQPPLSRHTEKAILDAIIRLSAPKTTA